MHLLWINLLTDGAFFVALGPKPGEAEQMERPPIDPQDADREDDVALTLERLFSHRVFCDSSAVALTADNGRSPHVSGIARRQ